MITSINHIERDLFIVETILSFGKGFIHVHMELVTGELKKHQILCDTYEV